MDTQGSGPVLGRQFCEEEPVCLILSVDGSTFMNSGYLSVSDLSGGHLIFNTVKKFSRIDPAKTQQLIDAVSGDTLITMVEKFPSWHGRWKAFRGGSKKPRDLLFRVKRNSLVLFETEWEVVLAGNTERTVCDFKIKGSYRDKSCVFYKGNSSVVVATMSRRELQLGGQSFVVTLNPNTDKAFITALIVILEQVHRAVLSEAEYFARDVSNVPVDGGFKIGGEMSVGQMDGAAVRQMAVYAAALFVEKAKQAASTLFEAAIHVASIFFQRGMDSAGAHGMAAGLTVRGRELFMRAASNLFQREVRLALAEMPANAMHDSPRQQGTREVADVVVGVTAEGAVGDGEMAGGLRAREVVMRAASNFFQRDARLALAEMPADALHDSSGRLLGAREVADVAVDVTAGGTVDGEMAAALGAREISDAVVRGMAEQAVMAVRDMVALAVSRISDVLAHVMAGATVREVAEAMGIHTGFIFYEIGARVALRAIGFSA